MQVALRIELILVAAFLAVALLAALVPPAGAAKPIGASKIRCTRIGKLKWCYASQSQVDVVGAPLGSSHTLSGSPTCAKLESIPGLVVVSCEPI